MFLITTELIAIFYQFFFEQNEFLFFFTMFTFYMYLIETKNFFKNSLNKCWIKINLQFI